METDELVQRIAHSKKSLFITVLTANEVSTFGPDNIEHFLPWTLVQLAKLQRHKYSKNKKAGVLSLVIREFTALRDAVTGIPIKRIAGCFIQDGEVHSLTAGEMRQAFLTDAQTGEPLDPEPNVTFIDFEQLVAQL
ncbi:hypothetical protein [Thiospirillum jenense]|uniref:Uncharacterized protein n=1 Tax=Thiospirillum jenense TaxID=1653858 RepID=A0A839HKY2_9GAMM|nr:hypothetical protein [Thiospirillum jenense]MBB1126422.1 hypothetical protein [Thiospirillum jenense]